MLYLYAIINRPTAPLPPIIGLGEQPVRYGAWGDVAAIYSHYEGPAPRAEAAHLWRHEEVVERLLDSCGVLPVRFGALLPDEAALMALLRERHDRFVAGLARVAGRVEVSVRALWTAEAPPPAPRPAEAENGRDYLARRMVEEQAREAWLRESRRRADALHVALNRLAVAHVRQAAHERILLSAAYLIPREALDVFRATVGDLGVINPDLRLLCTGPWPAYHFVEGA
ncbi:MAG: GvpL/GvpF family gas vesicle protein [Oscillochloridaceae bacterium]|nr:GvpL/GvpF family gas vesicle protein [Chloroflexaceae bacterium]MDW8388685.1 GvpL/GvpF family gas vesicle protein [Oscillochloridaceae bacterium]